MSVKADQRQYALHAMNAYNALNPSNATQAAFTGIAAMLAAFDTAAAVLGTHAETKKQLERWKNDMSICLGTSGLGPLGITDANIAADDLVTQFQDRLIAFNPDLTRTFFSGQHLQS